MTKIVSLPMYNWPELRAKTDQWWRVLAQNFEAEGLTQVPKVLNGQEEPFDDWNSPQLFMSQTCGYPLRHQFRGVFEVIAVPIYKAEGCVGSNYCSMVVARKDEYHLSLADFYDRRAAYNSEDSQSGYSSLRAVIAPLAQGKPFFSDTLKTGAHLNSMKAVATNRADICTIDCVSWGLAKCIFPELVASLCVIGQTPPAPSLPYVTAKSCSNDDLQRLRKGLIRSVKDQEHNALRAHLLLEGFEVLPADVYARIDEIEGMAIDAGYPVLH